MTKQKLILEIEGESTPRIKTLRRTHLSGEPSPYFWRSVLRDAMLTWPPLREQECLHSTTHQWYLPTSNATGQSARSNYCKTPEAAVADFLDDGDDGRGG